MDSYDYRLSRRGSTQQQVSASRSNSDVESKLRTEPPFQVLERASRRASDEQSSTKLYQFVEESNNKIDLLDNETNDFNTSFYERSTSYRRRYTDEEEDEEEEEQQKQQHEDDLVEELDAHWVTVFGLSSSSENYVLEYLNNKHGTIINTQKPLIGNWINVQFQSSEAVHRALSQSPEQINEQLIVGVMPGRCGKGRSYLGQYPVVPYLGTSRTKGKSGLSEGGKENLLKLSHIDVKPVGAQQSRKRKLQLGDETDQSQLKGSVSDRKKRREDEEYPWPAGWLTKIWDHVVGL